jgi:hypothetical protein
VDRGKGFEMAQQERALAAGGAQGGSCRRRPGQGGDYILVPDTSKNGNASGTNVGGLLGGSGAASSAPSSPTSNLGLWLTFF